MKRCRAITEKIAEEVSEITGEWLTIADMERMEFSEFLGFNLFCHDLKNVRVQVSTRVRISRFAIPVTTSNYNSLGITSAQGEDCRGSALL